MAINFNEYLQDIFTPIVALFGVFGNILSIIVLIKSGMLKKSTSTIILLALAISDLMFIVGETVGNFWLQFPKLTVQISNINHVVLQDYNVIFSLGFVGK